MSARTRLNALERSELEVLRTANEHRDQNLSNALTALGDLREAGIDLQDENAQLMAQRDEARLRADTMSVDVERLREQLLEFQADRGHLVGELLAHRFDAAWHPTLSAHVWDIEELGLQVTHTPHVPKCGHRAEVVESWLVTDTAERRVLDTEDYSVLVAVLNDRAQCALHDHADAYPEPTEIAFGEGGIVARMPFLVTVGVEEKEA